MANKWNKAFSNGNNSSYMNDLLTTTTTEQAWEQPSQQESSKKQRRSSCLGDAVRVLVPSTEQPTKKVHQDVLFRLPPPPGMPPCPKFPKTVPLMPVLEEDDDGVPPVGHSIPAPPVAPLVFETPCKQVTPLQAPPKLLQRGESPRSTSTTPRRRVWHLQHSFSPIVKRSTKTTRNKQSNLYSQEGFAHCSTPILSVVSQRVTPTEEIVSSRSSTDMEDEPPTPPPPSVGALPHTVFLPSDLEQEAAFLLVSLKTPRPLLACVLPKRRPCPQTTIGFGIPRTHKVVVLDPESNDVSSMQLRGVDLSDLDDSTLHSLTTFTSSSSLTDHTPGTPITPPTAPREPQDQGDNQEEEPPKKKRKVLFKSQMLLNKPNQKSTTPKATGGDFAKTNTSSNNKTTKTLFSRKKNKVSFPTTSCIIQANKRVPPQSRLAMPDDPSALNTLHCFVRSNLLELFTACDGDRHPRVGLRCVYCGKLPRKQNVKNTMSSFFPKSLQDLYRLVCTWQRVHFKTCPHVPDSVKDMYKSLKQQDKSRGKKQYWEESALRLGLRNVNQSRQGIVWNKDCSK